MTNVLTRPDLRRMVVDWQPAPAAVSCNPLAAFVRRLAEIAFCTALLALTLPLMLVTAVAIRLEGGGPVLFRQIRIGQHGAPFHVLKSRTMRTDAEPNGPVWATVNDPRITRIGALLRRSRIDELPQLLNVLRGDMSLVGPRPERPHFVELLAREIPGYHDRAAVKPGITGWAKVHGWRGETDTQEKIPRRVECDLYYIENWSIIFDMYILAITPLALTKSENAY